MPPTTRSTTLSTLASSATAAAKPRPSRSIQKSKRTTEEADIPKISSSRASKKARVEQSSTLAAEAELPPSREASQSLPATLSFSLANAKQHLINADARFEDIFNKLPCRPFEQLESVDSFHTLVTSILGQQISWLAARTIKHRFIRLYFPYLPEKPPARGSDDPDISNDLFPSASQVASTDVTTLKSAGLSTRKAEYVLDLASRFADGRLSNQKLAQADDEELAKLLIEVRGIGRWTVDMFAIFSMRRPDILPIGDLGVQRGVVRWFLSLHSPTDPVTISPEKIPVATDNETPNNAVAPKDDVVYSSTSLQAEPSGPLSSTRFALNEPDVPSISPVPSTPVKSKGTSNANVETPSASQGQGGLDAGIMGLLPKPFTPSINRTLYAKDEQSTCDSLQNPTPLPEGLTVASLKGRLNGKKIKGALLTPKEMEDLTEPWRPYRSIGVYYMWALAESSPSKPSKSSKPSKPSK